MPTKFQSLIVGGGIAGLSIAYEMSRLGEKQICLVDEGRSEVGHPTSPEIKLNATSRSAGIITSQLWPPLDPLLARETIDIISEVSNLEPSSTFVHSLPSLILCSRRNSYQLLNDLQSMMINEGMRSKMIEDDELLKKFPYVRSERLVGASYTESGLLIDPRKYLSSLMKIFKDKGGMVYQSKVADLIQKHGRITGIRTDAGTLKADRVIIAAGINSQELLGKYLPVSLNKYLTRSYFGSLKHGIRDLPMIYDMDHQIYIRRDGPKGIIIGGGMEMGLNVSKSHEIPIESQKEELNDWLEASFIPTVTNIVLKSEGLCSEPWDQKPLVGEVKSVGSLYCSFGFGGLGLTIAPSLSRNLSKSIVDGKMSNSLSDFAPEREG